VTGGTGPITYSIKAGGAIASGLTFNTADGSISGTPDTLESCTYTIVATDIVLATAESAPLSMTINALPVITTGSGSLPDWTVNVTGYSLSNTWTDGTAPFTWSWTGYGGGYGINSIPPGLSINSTTGLISGTPDTTGSYDVAITITDYAGQTNTVYDQVTINPPPALVSSLPDSTDTADYSHQLLGAFTGTAPFTFSSIGTLPMGTSLNDGLAVIDGTLGGDTYPATYNFTIGVEDACGVTATPQSYTVTVYEVPTFSPVTGTTLPDATVGNPYSQTLTVSGGNPPFSFSLGSGSVLPDGLNFNVSFDGLTCVIEGTPTTPEGPYTSYINASDASGVSFSGNYDLTVL
jgi:hypothetical protein